MGARLAKQAYSPSRGHAQLAYCFQASPSLTGEQAAQPACCPVSFRPEVLVRQSRLCVAAVPHRVSAALEKAGGYHWSPKHNSCQRNCRIS